MTDDPSNGPVAVLAGGGDLPALIAAAIGRQERRPVVFAIAGEADEASFGEGPDHVIRWGQLGRLLKLLETEGCRQAVFIGSINRRPDLASIVPDLGAFRFIPRLLQLMRSGDDSLLTGLAAIFAEQGIELVSPLDVAPDLALAVGWETGRVMHEARGDIMKAYVAAREIGRLDIGQAAVAVAGRVVAVEDAGGTDALLERVAALREAGRIPKAGGVLVKCLKPQQDRRLDVPTIGPRTAEAARRAGLDGVAAPAGDALLAGREQTLKAFRIAGLFLFGLTDAAGPGDG